MTGTEVERVERHGVSALEHFVVGKVLEAAAAPRRRPPQRLPGRRRRRRAEPDRLRRAERRRRPDRRGGQARRGHARRHQAQGGQAPRPAVQRHDPRRGRGGDRHRPRRDHGARQTSCRPGTPLAERAADRHRRAAARGHARTGRTAWASTASPARSTPPPARRWRQPPWAEDPAVRRASSTRSRITVECPDLCPRFTARAFEDVTIGPSPAWLKARLMAAGQRPISNVVDITNYVMLLTGQPLHAFDLDRIAGGAADRAHAPRDGETMRDARRPDPDARRRDGADRRRRRPDLDRRRDGRRPLRGRRPTPPGC